MKLGKLLKTTALFTGCIFTFEVALAVQDLNAQSINKIEERIGGDSTNKPAEDSNNNNTVLFIAAGAIMVGLIVWKVFLDKKEAESKDKSGKDSLEVSLQKPIFSNSIKKKIEVEILENIFPIEFYLPMPVSHNKLQTEDLSFGLRFKLQL